MVYTIFTYYMLYILFSIFFSFWNFVNIISIMSQKNFWSILFTAPIFVTLWDSNPLCRLGRLSFRFKGSPACESCELSQSVMILSFVIHHRQLFIFVENFADQRWNGWVLEHFSEIHFWSALFEDVFKLQLFNRVAEALLAQTEERNKS